MRNIMLIVICQYIKNCHIYGNVWYWNLVYWNGFLPEECEEIYNEEDNEVRLLSIRCEASNEISIILQKLAENGIKILPYEF